MKIRRQCQEKWITFTEIAENSPYNLNTNIFVEFSPGLPVILIKSVLDTHNREIPHKTPVDVAQSF